MTPRVTQAHLETRRREILAAGFRCLAQRGFQATTMQEIAAEAGLSVGSLYGYFENKEDLLRALAAEGADRRLSRIEDLGDDPASTTLGDLVSSMIDDLGDSGSAKDAVRLDVRLWAELLDRPEGRDVMLETMAGVRRLVAGFIRARRQAGDPAHTGTIDADAVGRLAVSLLTGLELQLAYEPRLDRQAYRDAVRTVFGAL